jgi:hypothetical protein
MKKLTFFVSLIAPFLIFAQNDSVSLKEYCPTKLGQKGALCFAYAPVYTALSIAHNVADNQTDEALPTFHVFSYGFVASKVKKDKSFFGRLFNRCGRNATVDLAFGVLLQTGTVPFNTFPQKCDCGKVNDLLQASQLYKIKDTTILGDETTKSAIHIQRIKAALKQKQPVVTAIVQETFFYNNKGNYSITFPANYQQNSASANHVVCIVGFNDTVNGGSFLVKNNYTSWGLNGFSYVRYTDLVKLIRSSYAFKI